MMDSALCKAELRTRYRAARDAIPADVRPEAEAQLLDRLFASRLWARAPLVCGYVSTRGEIDLAPLWARAVADGKTYALPRTVSGTRDGQMVLCRMPAYTPDALVPGRFGILEPGADCPVLTPAALSGALIVVPGLAFDTDGYRIGYGGGYYDRFLSALAADGIEITAVGLAFSVCLTDRLPHQSHDRPVDCIIDERRMLATHGIL